MVALSATLNQYGKPFVFFSQKLVGQDLNLAAPEKEALAILKAVQHWRLILLGQKFTILTDQRSIATIFSCYKTSKIIADRMVKWKILLAEFSYDIHYRPGTSNLGADGLSRLTHQGIVVVE